MDSQRMSGGSRATARRRGLLAACLLLGACSYGLTGGGFPDHVDTVFIESFENRTPNFELEQELFRSLLDRYPSALGVRTASRENADALLVGSITGYDDVVSNVSPGAGASNRPQVLTHEVRVTVSARLIDTRDNVILWEGQVSGRGTYTPETQTEQVGRADAIEMLVQELIDGALSQW